MKFPMPKNIFPPLELSEYQEHQYEQLANALIKATLAEYDHFVMHDRKRVDSKRWKTVRTQDGISIYREREFNGEPQDSSPATLALYRSASSTTSSRPSQKKPLTGPQTADTMDSGRDLNSVSHEKKNSNNYLVDDSFHTTGSEKFIVEPRITTGAFSRADNRENSSSLPRLLAVGSLRGSLDDVMYGVMSPSASSARLRSSYLGEHMADCAVLREIKSPTSADPFRFLGIKWFVRAKHRTAARIVLPRDFVILEFSGVMMRPDNSRVGFQLMHSVEIPTCHELIMHRIVRAKISSCYIFEETHPKSIQVFMTASVDPSGHVLNRVAMRSAATALSNCWKSVSCAHDKKLAFCLHNERPSVLAGPASGRGTSTINNSLIGSSRGRLSALTPVNESQARDSNTTESLSRRRNVSLIASMRQCGVCRGKLGILSRTVSCQMCNEQICTRCRIVRKLSSDTLKSQVMQSSINFCKQCVASVSDESALEIARQELWVRSRGRTRASSLRSTINSRRSFSLERNVYATVILGQTSDRNTRDSAVQSSQYQGPSSFGQSQATDDFAMGYSVGPLYPSSSTKLLTSPRRSSSSSHLSNKRSVNTLSVSTISSSSSTLTNEMLSLSDLRIDKTSHKAAIAVEPKVEEPVVLDRRLTATLRSLRHLDYVLSVDEQDIVDELDNDLESDELAELESVDDGSEIRSSYASSVAVMDDDSESCLSFSSNGPLSQSQAPIFEVEEGGESEEDMDLEKQVAGEMASDTRLTFKSLETDQEDEHFCRRISLESEEDEEIGSIARANSMHADNEGSHATMVENAEVVEVAPISEAQATMVAQHDIQRRKFEPENENCERKTIPSVADSSTYKHQLFQQMQDLHHVVESTYQVARANTEAAFKERDSGRTSKASPKRTMKTLRSVRTFSQPFAFAVVGLRSTRAMTVSGDK